MQFLHYFYIRKLYHKISSQYHHQEQSSSTVLGTPKIKSNAPRTARTGNLYGFRLTRHHGTSLLRLIIHTLEFIL